MKKIIEFYSKLLRSPWAVLMIIVFLGFNYNYRLVGLLGSIIIILLSRKAWPENWVNWLGLKFNKKSIALSIILLPVIIIASYLVILQISAIENISYRSWLADPDILGYIHSFSQTLNEEMILGALLLNALRKYFSKLHPLWIALSAAAVFALLHYPFYAWIVFGEHSGEITIVAILTLFTIGVVRNNLILQTGHIGYAWALHLGFNIVFFRGDFYDLAKNIFLNQPERFNLILGSYIMLIIGIIILIASLLLYRKDFKIFHHIKPC